MRGASGRSRATSLNHMRIAVAGTGGLGGYFGGLLARAGHDVVFLARGAHLDALRRQGLTVHSVHGDFHLNPVQATDDPAEIHSPVELLLFTVKTYDTDRAAELVRPLVGPGTGVLPFQNGVESAERLERFFGREAMLAGATWIVSALAEPGVIRQESQFRRIVFGELNGEETPRAGAIRDAFLSAGLTADLSSQIETVLWAKTLFLASFSGLSSLTRAPAGPLRTCAESRALLQRAMEEVEAVARAKGLALDPDVVPQTMGFVDGMEPATTSSMQRDVAAGRRLEYDAINGAVVRAGRTQRMPTPVHEFFWTCLKVIDAASGGLP